jgi:hypothetical protein
MLTEIRTHCKSNGLIRKSAPKEQEACDKIIDCIDNTLPRGGNSIYLGTPTAVAISECSRFKKIILDNYLVADRLKRTSDKLEILIGNIVNRQKALAKVRDFKSLQYMGSMRIEACAIDGPAFYRIVNREAKRNSILKVVLMTSGSWDGKDSRYNFSKYANRLIAMYPHIHIIAMRYTYMKMHVLHLHNGKTEEL